MSLHGNFGSPRAIWTQPLFYPDRCFTEGFTKLEAWLWLVSHAVTHDQVRQFGKKGLPLQRGQCAASTRELAARWMWSQGRTRRFLKSLKSESLIDSEPFTQTTLITIKNYDQMQSVDSLSDSLKRSEPEMVAAHPSRRGRLTAVARKILQRVA